MDIEKINITVDSPKYAGIFESKGYAFPTERYQRLRADGSKTGFRTRYVLPHTFEVFTRDLPHASHFRVNYTCEACGRVFSTTFFFYKRRKTNMCRDCNSLRLAYTKPNAKSSFDNRGKHYWKKKLIWDEPSPVCEISGEADPRFLCVHHLKPRHLGGKEERDNIVVITANYHQAYHQEMGNNQSAQVNKESYLAFKARELQKLAALRSHTQGA